MGGRGAGVNIISDSRDKGRTATWITVTADLNRAASGRNVSLDGVSSKDKDGNATRTVGVTPTLIDFADASREKFNGKCEVMGLMDDQGYVVKALEGGDGYVKYTPEQRRQMSGYHITHYHNRIVPSDAEKREIAEDNEKYKAVRRAYNRYWHGRTRYAEADKEEKRLRQELKRRPGDRAIMSQIADCEKERSLALRQIDRARDDFQQRADDYEGPKPNRIPKRFASLIDVAMPIKKLDTRDETGYIGGCFSEADLSSNLLAKDIPTFSASCDEGFYQVAISPNTTDGEVMSARGKIHELWIVPRKDAKKELSQDAYRFQRHLRGIDMKTNEEGRKKGWSMQKRRAISFNRQMAYVWDVQKGILEKHGIAAIFKENPNYKPVFKED